ncbi:DUF2585 family protein [Falsirhodobacter deserti]|uniref:DUF2585 family protein n=1 Tax=Falsirhodobacter deserti TaxID=1365611 RepID=UPI0013E2A6D9|nr:DUF2585 family protein [Falsirhodobacter deserti]
MRTPPPVLPAVAVILVLQTALLLLVGRNFGCDCGGTRLWQGSMDPAHNSQHLSDPYSFLHLGFGMALLAFFSAIRPHWRRRHLALLVLVSSAIWEVMENQPVIIALFGYDAGDPLAYDGDSIVNSLGDTGFTMIGALIALGLPLWAIVAVVAAIELTLSVTIGDGYVIALLRAIGLL